MAIVIRDGRNFVLDQGREGSSNTRRRQKEKKMGNEGGKLGGG